jgi:hypothetical protein
MKGILKRVWEWGKEPIFKSKESTPTPPDPSVEKWKNATSKLPENEYENIEDKQYRLALDDGMTIKEIADAKHKLDDVPVAKTIEDIDLFMEWSVHSRSTAQWRRDWDDRNPLEEREEKGRAFIAEQSEKARVNHIDNIFRSLDHEIREVENAKGLVQEDLKLEALTSLDIAMEKYMAKYNITANDSSKKYIPDMYNQMSKTPHEDFFGGLLDRLDRIDKIKVDVSTGQGEEQGESEDINWFK